MTASESVSYATLANASRVMFSGCAAVVDDIVFDANAAEGLELLDHRPIDVGAPRVGVRRGQQRIDQVNAGLHRHHHARARACA